MKDSEEGPGRHELLSGVVTVVQLTEQRASAHLETATFPLVALHNFKVLLKHPGLSKPAPTIAEQEPLKCSEIIEFCGG